MQFPLDDDLGQLDGQPAMIDRRRRTETQSLDRVDHVLNEVVPDRIVDLVVSNDQLEDVVELLHRVALLDDDLLRPVGEHLEAVLHANRHRRRYYLERLLYDVARLHRVSFQ